MLGATCGFDAFAPAHPTGSRVLHNLSRQLVAVAVAVAVAVSVAAARAELLAPLVPLVRLDAASLLEQTQTDSNRGADRLEQTETEGQTD